MTYDEVTAIALANVGRRLRITAPNGVQIVGVVGTWRNRSTDEVLPTLDNRLMGGEYAGMAGVEVMAANGRYVPAGGA